MTNTMTPPAALATKSMQQGTPHAINADLHCHSTVSDGTLQPAALAALAHANGVQMWSLTDHDEVGGQVEARQAAEALGMRYISGVEISITWLEETVHIVGLNIDPFNPTLVEGLAKTRSGRSQRAKDMAEGLRKVGIEGAYEGALRFVGNPELISRTHFARYLVEIGHCQDTYEVFTRYLVEGKPGYVGHRWASLEEAVNWIVQAGGIAVIAHPGRYKRLNHLQMDLLFTRFKEAGGRGIEVITGSHTSDQYRSYAKVAQEFGFLASRGSDFHGPKESRVALGALPNLPESVTPVWAEFG